MQFADNDVTAKVTERVMAALRRADVLKPDERDHYNGAFSAVYEALLPLGMKQQPTPVQSIAAGSTATAGPLAAALPPHGLTFMRDPKRPENMRCVWCGEKRWNHGPGEACRK